MRRFPKIAFAVVMLMVIVLAGVVGFRYVRAWSQPPKRAERIDAVKVYTSAVSRGAIERNITLTGEIKPLSRVEIKPKITARLERLALDDGTPVAEDTWVRKGQILAVLDHKDLQAGLAQADAAVKVAEAAIVAADVNVKDRLRERNRMENLFKEGSATEQQRDLAATDHERAVAALAQAKAQLAQAQAARQLANTILDEAFLRAPLTGVVCDKYVDEGNMVSPATVVVCIVKMDELKILVEVPAEHLKQVERKEVGVDFRVDAYSDRLFPAQIYPTVHPETRTATVEIRFHNPQTQKSQPPNYLLRPGMYATVRIVLDRKDNVVTVPADCVIRRLNEYLVFVVDGNTSHLRKVRLGIWSADRVEITEGLTEGEELVVRGHHKLTDGTLVEPTRWKPDAGEDQP